MATKRLARIALLNLFYKKKSVLARADSSEQNVLYSTPPVCRSVHSLAVCILNRALVLVRTWITKSCEMRRDLFSKAKQSDADFRIRSTSARRYATPKPTRAPTKTFFQISKVQCNLESRFRGSVAWDDPGSISICHPESRPEIPIWRAPFTLN